MDWHESDQSEEEIHANNRKRSSRGEATCVFHLPSPLIKAFLACDQCRKTKSKCERSASDNVPCKSCAVAGTSECRASSVNDPLLIYRRR